MGTGDGLKPRPRRRWDGITQWIVNLDTGRFGTWVVIETPDTATEEDVRRQLTRSQRRRASSIRRVIR